MRAWRTLLACGGITSIVFSQGAPAKPDTPEQAADKILAAVAAKDDAALKSLAEKDDPDPWLVADELCERGAHDAALAFAKAAPRPDTEKLPAYVDAQRGRAPDPERHKAVDTANRALQAGEPEDALAAIDAAKPGGEDVTSARLLHGRGFARRSLGRLEESAEAFLAAADNAERLGWLSCTASGLQQGGMSCDQRSDASGALNAWERRLRVEEARNDRRGVAGALGDIGFLHVRLGMHEKALVYHERALAIMEEMEDRHGIALANGDIGVVYLNRGEHAKALKYLERTLAIMQELGDRQFEANTLGNIGNVHFELGAYTTALGYYERTLAIADELADRHGIALSLDRIGDIQQALGAYPKALGCYERALSLMRELGNRGGVAGDLSRIGNVHSALGAYSKSLESHERALALAEELADPQQIALILGDIGDVHFELGEYPKALGCYERALALKMELGNRGGVAETLGDIGSVHWALGEYTVALEHHEQALAISEERGNRGGVARSLGNIGNVHNQRGAYAKALEYYERALAIFEELGSRVGIAESLINIGSLYGGCGAFAKALDHYERAKAMKQEMGDRAGLALTLMGIGNIHRSLRTYAVALEYHERAWAIAEELDNRAMMANILGNIGGDHYDLGAYAKALECSERALAIEEGLGNRHEIASTLGRIGAIHAMLGAYEKALEYWERQLALAAEAGGVETEMSALRNIAAARLNLGDARRAGDTAREGVKKLPLLVGKLSEELGASVRGQWAGLVATGARASARLGDPAEVSYFLESGRAGTLLESLGGREVLRDVTISGDLAAAERDAWAAVIETTARLARAHESGRLDEIREARTALEGARESLLRVVERIQREAKAGADVAYPEAAPLDKIRAVLAEGEALVSYALLKEEAVALVATRDSARIVDIGKTSDVRQAAAALALDPAAPWHDAVAAARKALLDPLKLPVGTRRVLVCPDGSLAYVPFAALTDLEVAYAPSGTTYILLRDEGKGRGEGVLALGDPDYGAKRDRHANAVLLRSGPLLPLPGTRAEAKAVGDIVLLGEEATEPGLRDVLTKRPRWRAVHLACHGVVDPERPLLSSLALTLTVGEDGFLTTLEVFRMRIPADLVVLSACDTGKGRAYEAEGVVGFVRAFMCAGAPRVMVSLWRVDDEATQALMMKFYELWNPKDGSKGLPTATALKKAMEFVRDHPDHPEWKDPKYWAAWQLWGLPD